MYPYKRKTEGNLSTNKGETDVKMEQRGLRMWKHLPSMYKAISLQKKERKEKEAKTSFFKCMALEIQF
jgi:hypothetical protein